MQVKFLLTKILGFLCLIGSHQINFVAITPNLLIFFDNQELSASIKQTAWGMWSVNHNSSNMQKILK